MAVWSLNFVSVGGIEYKVEVDGCSSAVNLIGSVEAFVTQEDDSEDVFVPVRLQSGYLRIVDNGKDADNNAFNWQGIIPSNETSRPITLTDEDNNSVMWRGFVAPQSYGGQWKEYAQVREIPVMCQLSALQGFEFTPLQDEIVNFGRLLFEIFSKAGTWGKFYFQGSHILTEILYKRVNMTNLYDKDDNGQYVARYNALALLEEICKFWGWSCRTYGSDVYFYTPDVQQPWVSTYLSEFNRIAQDLLPNYSTESWQSDSTSATVFANNDNQILYLRGIRKASVHASVNPQPSILQVDFGEIEDAINAESNTVESVKRNDTYYFHKWGLADGYENQDYQVLLYWTQADIRAQFYLYDEYTGNLNYKHNYNWKCFLKINDGNDTYAARFKSKHPVSLEHCVVTINASTVSVSNGYMICRLRIGSFYWDGSGWVSSPSTFNIPFGNEETPLTEEGSGSIFSNRVLNSNRPPYEGHGIPIGSGAISGDFVFDIVSVYTNDVAGQRVVDLTSFEISTVRYYGYSENASRSENTYTVNGGIFSEEASVETIFATDNGNNFGLGLIMNPDGSYCTEVTCDDRQERPEYFLAWRMAMVGNHVRKSLRLNLRTTHINEITPLYYLTADGMYLYPFGISHQWADDITTLALYEI